MTNGLSLPRLAAMGSLALLITGVTGCSQHWSIPHIYRVLAYQDSDFADIHHFPARTIEAPESHSDLPVVLDDRVAGLIEQHPDIDKFDTFLENTDTSAFLIVHEGNLITERYLQGHDRESLQNTFSVSKSVTSALIGLARHDGALELEAPITRYLPELAERDERFGRITVDHLLNMRSGIEYSHDTSFPFVNADDALIYYHPDLESIALKTTTIASDPGTFQYNNYNPPLLGLILRRTTEHAPAEYLERKLWHPLGARWDAGWTTDDHGFERMESGFHARARDLARLGLLYLNDGQVNGKRVLPASWIATSTEFPVPPEIEQYDGRTWGYHLGWWIVPRPEGPSDFAAIGRYGQFIYVSPQYDVVFIRNGPGRGDWGDYDWTGLFYFVAERL